MPFIFDLRYSSKIISLVFCAIIFSLLGEWLHLPIPWLLVPMFVSFVWVLIKGKSQVLPSSFNVLGQSIVAVVTACRFSLDILIDLQDYFLPLLLCIIVTAIFSILNSYVISKWANIDWKTSFLGCIPGSSASIVAMSDEMGADTIAVAVLQCIRIVMVSVITPLLVSFYIPDNNLMTMSIMENQEAQASLPLGLSLAILFLVAIVGIKLGEKIKLPSNLFLAPFFSCLIFISFFPYKITIPHSIFCAGLLFLGLSIGIKFETKSVIKLAKALLIELFLVLLLITACFAAGYEFHRLTHIDTMTALLGSTPGALNAMMATVIELGGDSSLVLTMQLSRMLLILACIPLITNLLPKKSRSSLSNHEKL